MSIRIVLFLCFLILTVSAEAMPLLSQCGSGGADSGSVCWDDITAETELLPDDITRLTLFNNSPGVAIMALLLPTFEPFTVPDGWSVFTSYEEPFVGSIPYSLTGLLFGESLTINIPFLPEDVSFSIFDSSGSSMVIGPPATVPEPANLLLMSIGLLLLIVLRHKQKKIT